MRFVYPLLAVLIAGCATLVGTLELDKHFGPPNPNTFDNPPPAVASAPDYRQDVQPVLDKRCVACHACYDAPCQLNLTNYAGITRGANPMPVYSSARLVADEPTRLGIDAQLPSQWRNLGFFPVLNERQQSPEANREGSVLYRMLALKAAHPGPTSGPIVNSDLDFSLDRNEMCVRAEGFDHYAASHPERGMPFGLPEISQGERAVLNRWVEAGAPYTPPTPLPDAIRAQVAAWETFLNGNTLQQQLAARYVYEHWFVGHLYFPEAPNRYFQLVRSRTPPGEPIEIIATRRPFDDPGVARPYYRLRYFDQTPVAKTFMPLPLDAARMARIQHWLMPAGQAVEALPGYAPDIASNPFITFRDLPIDGRYRFMLDDAEFMLMGFMKGPVCRGQVALNVINDVFWVAFIAPGGKESAQMAAFLEKDAPNLDLPAEYQSNTGLLAWRHFGKLEQRYLAAKSKFFAKLPEKRLPRLEDLWDGDGTNPNAALTVFRHFDSASVIRGFAGDRPQTMIVLGYPLFERMHYLLLAGFDVYGNIGHQLATRLYMDFLRMEGELNFLAFLPMKDRQMVLNYWYRGRSTPHDEYFADASAYFPRNSGVRYRTKAPLDELYKAVAARMAPLRAPQLDWKKTSLSAAEIEQMRKLSQIRGIPASQMPEQSLLLLQRPGRAPELVSLVRNSAHSNIAEMFDEADRRLPKEDTLWALYGVVGNYPNAMFAVDPEKLPEFVEAVGQLAKPEDLVALTARFGVRRTDPRFWQYSDAIHARWQQIAPREAAVLDYSRLENR